MTTFLERWRGRASSHAAFGDSIAEAGHIARPEQRWANRLDHVHPHIANHRRIAEIFAAATRV
jgi:hypothetical protein